MSKTSRTVGDGGIEDDEFESSLDPELVVELLRDHDAIDLFQTATRPMTIQELTDACGLSQSTAYRKVEKLHEAGLLVETTPKSPDGDPPAKYKRRAAAITVTVADSLDAVCSDHTVEPDE